MDTTPRAGTPTSTNLKRPVVPIENDWSPGRPPASRCAMFIADVF